jgi:antirestriction protein ArdC
MCIRQTITDKIISILETGAAKGMQRWTQAASGMPRNAKTGETYRGVNVLLLWAQAAQKSYSSNLWLTYKQAEALGAQVRKGEKSTMGVYFQKVERQTEDDTEDAKSYPMAKAFFLFNVAQIDGLPAELTTPAPAKEFSAIEEAEQVINQTGAKIRHGFDGAFYVPSKDEVCMPHRERFTSESSYYATALHELAHWTGHESRLARTFGKRFGDDAYAMEELTAELSAAFSMGYLGMVEGTIEGHASYLEGWIKVLKQDKQAIFTAASSATKATDWVVLGGAAAAPLH